MAMSILYKTILVPVYLISYIFPRSGQIWLFGDNNQRFADNSKYLFLFVHNTKKNIKAVWISKDKHLVALLQSKGYSAEYKFSPKGLYLGLRAKVYIHHSLPSSINFWTSGGAFIVNLWHGVPLKKIGYDAKKHKIFSKDTKTYTFEKLLRRLTQWNSSRFDLLVVTSKKLIPQMKQAFRSTDSQILLSGYPRNQVFFQEFAGSISDREEVLRATLDESNMFNVLYAPTFRDSGQHPLNYSELDLQKLNDFLSSNRIMLWMKFHLLESKTGDRPDLSKYPNIQEVDPLSDIYPFLPKMKCLITDYSSIYIDYLLLNRPVVFFAYDLKQYMTDDRGMYYNYDEVAPGVIATNQDAMQKALYDVCIGKDEYVEERMVLRDRFHNNGVAEDACEIIFEKVMLQI
jgi:CDP-glycerol glycerophosphotransferase (TagB/SpsB family)